jgi:hypothetical protein
MRLLMLINEIVITAMETIGMIMVAVGLGVFASWLAGVAGFFVVSGGGLVGAAYIAACQQAKQADEANSKRPPPEPPAGLVNTIETVQRYKAERQAASVRDEALLP